jgi:hypothetical protein
MIVCRDCLHCSTDHGKQAPLCLHPRSYQEMTVYYSGQTYTLPLAVETMRTLGPCGPEATLFAPRNNAG